MGLAGVEGLIMSLLDNCGMSPKSKIDNYKKKRYVGNLQSWIHLTIQKIQVEILTYILPSYTYGGI